MLAKNGQILIICKIRCALQGTHQVSVQGEKNQGVYGHVGGDVDQVLDDLAPEVIEGPTHGVVYGRWRDTGYDEEQVRRSQVLQRKLLISVNNQ